MTYGRSRATFGPDDLGTMMLELAIAPVLAAGLLQATGADQGLAIQHKPVKCIVAEKYPRLNACFAPPSQLARARVYFRVAEGPPDWYYVAMKSDAPCFSGILPRPKRELIGRHVQYYLDASDKKFAESRTAETEALVVKSESDCEDRLLAAPWLDKATVTVFPRVPTGFAGAGLGIGAKAAIAGGAALIVGGGTAAILGGSGGSTPTTTTTTTTTTTAPPTTTTTTLPPQVPFLPVFKVYRGGALQGDTISGPDPLPLLFDMCDSSGPFPLRFNVEVDGAQTTAGCQSWITFTATGASALRAAGVRGSANRAYSVVMWVRSVSPDNEPKEKRKLTVEIASAGGCSTDRQGPLVSLTSPVGGSSYPTPDAFPVRFRASADDSGTGNNGIASVGYKVDPLGPNELSLGPVTGGAPWPFDWSASAVNAWIGSTCSRSVNVQAYAEDGCGNVTYSQPVSIGVANPNNCDVMPANRSAETVSLISDLAVPGGSGQVVANAEATFPRVGRTPVAVRPRPGENRIEATLVGGSGPGTWLFDLQSVPGLRPESLRVIAGDVAQAGDGVVTFRLRGRAGERIVFSFRVEPDSGR